MFKHTLLVAALLAFSTSSVYAREGHMGHGFKNAHVGNGHMTRDRHAKRQSFTTNSTKTLANGQTITRNTTQSVTDNGFTRNSNLTNSQGQTASKNISVVNDKETGTRTRTVEGSTFDGDAFGHQNTIQKTDNGFVKNSSFTTPEGKTGSKEVVGVIDKEAGTFTKNITINTPNGDTKQHSVTHQFTPKNSSN